MKSRYLLRSCWIEDHRMRDSHAKCWQSRDAGALVFISNVYSEYTSGIFLGSLLDFLMSGSGANTLTVRSIENDDFSTNWKREEIGRLVEYFESRASHGQWFVCADINPIIYEDLIESLSRLSPAGFFVYIDLDSALIAVVGSELKQKLFPRYTNDQ